MGLFDGLKKFGLGNLEKQNIYEKDDKKTSARENAEKKAPDEKDYLYQKQYTCPLCDNRFTQPAIRSGHLKLIGQDRDLRPRYADVDVNKYDVILCNKCGYAALTRYFGPLASPHKKLLQQEIEANYQPMPEIGETISYEQARPRYQLALANAVVRKAHNSEKALICLRAGWLARGMAEEIQHNKDKRLLAVQEMEDGEEVITDELRKEFQDKRERIAKKFEPRLKLLAAEEEEYLRNAREGFLMARQEEHPPIAGMNEITLDYLLGVLCIRFGQYEDAYKLIQGIVMSKTAGNAQKDKARDLLNEIRTQVKAE